MTDQSKRLEAFVKLGAFLRDFCIYAKNGREKHEWSTDLMPALEDKISLAKHKNGWFTKDNILFSLHNWSNALQKKHITEWIAPYSMSTKSNPKKVALIMAGNIPLVGFHDFLSVLITGNVAVIKLSSNDQVLLPFIAEIVIAIEPIFKQSIFFEEGQLEEFDMVIATGSNNTARYFEYYFKNKPHIIRKSRNSVAVLTGKESKEELTALGEDIFQYYGLGCRSVSKLFVPKGYNFDLFFEALYGFKSIIDEAKYANNYDYNKAVYLMSEFKLLENGFLILKEDRSYSSPIASLFYETYTTIEEIKMLLTTDEDQIQCIVSNGIFENEIKFGNSQKPKLSDYADHVDTVDFLLRNS